MLSSAEWTALVTVMAGNVVALLSGVIGLALTVLGIVFRRNIGGKAMIAGGLVGVLWSPVMAWRDMYRERNAAMDKVRELSEPQLHGDLEHVIVGSRARGSDVIVTASIRNLGAPTSVDCCRLIVHMLGASRPVVEEPVGIPEVHRILDAVTGDRMIFYASEVLYTRTFGKPLDRGAWVRGRLFFRLDNVPRPDLVRGGTRYVIAFYDVRKKEQTASLVWDPSRLTRGIPDFPGLTSPHEPEKPASGK